MSPQTITCPHCQKPFALDDVLTHQIEENLQKQFEEKQQQKLKEFEEKEKILKEQQIQLEVSQKESEQRLKKQLEESRQQLEKEHEETMRIEKERLLKEAKAAAARDKEDEMKLLNEQLTEKEKKLDEARKAELSLRKEKNELEESKKMFELEKQRQLDEERKKIQEEAQKKVQEEYHLKDAEKDKKLRDLTLALEEAQRKAQQGSQQTQGEVLELELEELLRTTFPHDEIIAVGKGIHGADIIQRVHSAQGRLCGTIVWESKHTKSWTDTWIPKLKADQREQKAELAVIVSVVLPGNVKNFAQQDGVWITNFASVVGLATALRVNLIQVAFVRFSSIGKNEKMEVLYNYLTGTQFQQRVEAIVDSFTVMKQDLEKEKRQFKLMWAKREKQIDQIIDNTSAMHGDLQGLIGNALPQIKMLELPQAEDDEETTRPGML